MLLGDWGWESDSDMGDLFQIAVGRVLDLCHVNARQVGSTRGARMTLALNQRFVCGFSSLAMASDGKVAALERACKPCFDFFFEKEKKYFSCDKLRACTGRT